VLRPGGVFLAVEIQDRWLHRIGHFQSTFVAVAPADVPKRLARAGFRGVNVGFPRAAFRIRARKPATSHER
jgi:hypothetical protein